MQVVSTIESYFERSGKIRDYSGRIGNNSEIVTIQVPKNGLQDIFLPQNSFLDRRKITAVQIIASDSQNNGVTNTGTVSETLPVESLPQFQLTFAKNQEIIAVAPFSVLHTASNGGKYYFFCSEEGRHRIGDCFITQIGNGSLGGRLIILKFFYD